jgi:hypothetical protein
VKIAAGVIGAWHNGENSIKIISGINIKAAWHQWQ